ATYADACGISGMTGSSCNLFQPGVLTGKHPQFINYGKGVDPFHPDKNNIAPSLGMTWRPTFDKGFLHKIAGQDGDTVLFGSYAMAYERQDMNQYTTTFGTNPGVSLSTTRNATLGNLNNDGLGLPVFLSQSNRLGPAPFPSSLAFPW